jgi:site-specific recombinase XerD
VNARSDLQIREARQRYIRSLHATRDLSPHTIRAYSGDLAGFAHHLGGETHAQDVDPDAIISFLEVQKEAGLSPATLRRRSSAIRGFCAWMTSQGLVGTNPSSEATISLGRSRRLPRAVPAHELDRLLRFLEETAGIDIDRPLEPGPVRERPHESTTLLACALMVATGVRVHEVVGLRCQDIDLPARTMRLVGKGQRERQVFLTNDWITGLTQIYLEVRRELAPRHHRLLFNLRHEPLTPAAMRSRLTKAAAAAGLSTRITPHMLRHTAATQLIEAGVDIRYIQRLLGHASLSTTEIYTHVSDRALKRVVSDADVLGRVTQAR